MRENSYMYHNDITLMRFCLFCLGCQSNLNRSTPGKGFICSIFHKKAQNRIEGGEFDKIVAVRTLEKGSLQHFQHKTQKAEPGFDSSEPGLNIFVKNQS